MALIETNCVLVYFSPVQNAQRAKMTARILSENHYIIIQLATTTKKKKNERNGMDETRGKRQPYNDRQNKISNIILK